MNRYWLLVEGEPFTEHETVNKALDERQDIGGKLDGIIPDQCAIYDRDEDVVLDKAGIDDRLEREHIERHGFACSPEYDEADNCTACGNPIDHDDPHTECEDCRS